MNRKFREFVYKIFPEDPKFRTNNIWQHIGTNLLACLAIVTIIPIIRIVAFFKK